jgi:LCP family protein required for cell wall assembly
MIDFKKKLEEADKREGREPDAWEEAELAAGGKKRKRFATYTIAIIVVALIFSGRILISSQNATNWFPGGEMIISGLRHLIPSADKKLQGEESDRVNILLLGMGGPGHDGAFLTDTMMLAGFKPSAKQVALVSLPRDLVAPVSDWQKINSINAYAEQKEPNSGGRATAAAMSQLLQMPINYYIKVDFNGFAQIIDELGGVTVNVENTLDDYEYPIDGQEDNPNYYARFERLHIDKGWQTMSGALALKYVRSRHAAGPEGSDFARARRQQLVLEAVKDKLLSTKTLLNPVVVTKLINELNKNIATNLNVWEMLRLWNLLKDVDRTAISNKVLSDAPDGLLVSGRGEDGAYILTPRSGNFSEVRNLVQNIFTLNAPILADERPATITDHANVLVLNGTWVTGLAGKTAVVLEQYKFNILKTGNAPERNYAQTTVYDLTLGAKPASLSVLKKATGAYQSFSLPAWLADYQTVSSTPDFLLILGTDANKAE